MKVLLLIFLTFLHVSLSLAVSECKCPKYKGKINNRGVIGANHYCGYEIIEKRRAANQPANNCNSNSVYVCIYGPNGRATEVLCDQIGNGTAKCIPGGDAYYKVGIRAEEQKIDHQVKDPEKRFCATAEGMNGVHILFNRNYLNCCK